MRDVVKLIDERIKKLVKEKKRVPYLCNNKRRIHPAWKQINGRIQELRYIRKKISKI